MDQIEQTKITVTHKTNEFPSGLITSKEIEDQIGISSLRIDELADSGYVPHYRIDGGLPRYKISEVKKWLACNLVQHFEGKDYPEFIRVVIPADYISENPPESIQNIKNLKQLPKYGYTPGVYFLCKGNDVIYVGQSVSPSNRVSQHVNDIEKDFDRVYLLSVPESELNNVEGAFIKHLKPSHQGGIKRGKQNPVTPVMTKDYCDVLRDIYFDLVTAP